ncbi:DNA-binding protein [Desulfoluna sp.]|uniref:SLOG cluster 4 domain-containing protein n=1 Tax=Desulfoluna sp. TaxID=2045199 RepID=UPI00263A3AD1|nr:DNA-binding protein [Desulfoluna sp.]
MSLLLDIENGLICPETNTQFTPRERCWVQRAPEERPPTGSPLSLKDAVRWLQAESGHPCRIPVAVIGGREATDVQLHTAQAMGNLLGQMGLTLICGGRQGIMEAACKGSAMAGGISVGILPDADPTLANPYVTVPIATGIGVARNAPVAQSALCLIAIGGGHGTPPELAFGLQFEKQVFGLVDPPDIKGVVSCASPEQAADHVARVVLGLTPDAPAEK